MIDREVLAAALEKPWPVHWEKNSIIAAATKYLAQLPEKCGTCMGTGIIGTFDHIDQGTGEHQGTQAIGCDVCHGSGKVYPADRIERVERALIAAGYFVGYKAAAVAVLDALNGTADG